MTTPFPTLENLRLESHPTTRSRAVSQRDLSPGSVVISIPSLTTVLLSSEKGRRCDACHTLQSEERPLRKCSGCLSYWYCDIKCQNLQWKAHHKHICEPYRHFTASQGYQRLAPHERLDAVLLSHLMAEHYLSNGTLKRQDAMLSMFLSLIEGPIRNEAPPTCPNSKTLVRKDVVNRLYARFGNNNFAIHSHLTCFAHGIFPLASRLFNHSCVPNAAAKYIIKPFQSISMEVVALTSISQNEEVCLPYMDPALLQSRRHILESAYGFRCTCSSCAFLQNIGHIPDPPKIASERAEMEKLLRQYVFPAGIYQDQALTLPSKLQNETFPSSLHPLLHESFLAGLSERFSRSSHEGRPDVALVAGLTLVALYVLIYPHNYPQIGLHLLEMAKTAWNATIVFPQECSEDAEATSTLLRDTHDYLSSSRRILSIFGPEGDEGGPLEEIRALQGLLDTNGTGKASRN